MIAEACRWNSLSRRVALLKETRAGYTLNYVYKGRKGSQERKYFDSVKLN